MQSWSPLFVPIFVAAFRRAEELSTAMESRGFRGTQYRTRLYPLHMSRRDLLAALITLAFSLAILGLERVM